jgi:hypothetical protein
METASILGLRGPLPSDLYIAIPWMCLWTIPGGRWATAVLAQYGEVASSGQLGKADACECEKRPGNEQNNNGLFKLGTTVLR